MRLCPPLADDCFAARLACALVRRLGDRAPALARARLTRAAGRGEVIKADLYLAVTVILGDAHGTFSRSRA